MSLKRPFEAENGHQDEHEELQLSLCIDKSSTEATQGLSHDLPNGFDWKGFSYTARDKPKLNQAGNWTRMYRCVKHCPPKQCKGTLQLKVGHNNDKIVTLGKCNHSCQDEEEVKLDAIFDARKHMREEIALAACLDPCAPAKQLAKKIRQDFKQRYFSTPAFLLTINQLEKAVYAARSKEFGEWENIVRSFPLCLCSPTAVVPLHFFQFMLDVVVKGTIEKLVGWAHPKLLFWANAGAVQLFLDCSFYMVPLGFEQLLTIMMYSPLHSMYIPLWFILLQSKNQLTYSHAIRQAKALTPGLSNVAVVTSDFELGLCNAISEHFPQALYVACLFHFKQALRKRLVKEGVPPELVHELIKEDGLIGLLTVIPICEIKSKGIPYIRSKFPEGSYSKQFDSFWKYFSKTWLSIYNPEIWNVNGILSDPSKALLFLQRTNNPVERFNRTMCDAFPTAHPKMPAFVETLAGIANNYVDSLENIHEQALERPSHKLPTFFQIPEDYCCFGMPKKTGKRPKKHA